MADKCKLTDHELSELERLAKLGLTQAQIADFFGFSERTMARRLEHPKAVAAYKKGRSNGLAEVTKCLYQKILEGDKASMFFYLKCQWGWRETDPNAATDPRQVAAEIMGFVQAAKKITEGDADD